MPLPLLALVLQVSVPAPDCWAPPPDGAADSARLRAALAPRTMTARRLASPAPAIDGRLDEAVWCGTLAAGDFVESGPRPGALASLPTLARLLFDDHAIYVGVRLADPHPDSLVAPITRRDDETNSDWVFVEVDSRFDRQTGFSFGLNPRQVQVDGTWTADVNFDVAWNGVWTGAARIDSAGWTAEFRIPFSQLALGRNRPDEPMRWGINLYRYAPHRGETSNWSPRLPSVVGVVSHFNHLVGLRVPPHHANLELVPFAALAGRREAAGRQGVDLTPAAGLDVRVRPSPATSAALSLFPDFGQVEADPAEVNLTTVETYFPERRALFVEAGDAFRFPSALAFATRATSFAEEAPYYSRRVGSPPHGGVPDGATPAGPPGATTLLGAVRVSGRAGAWSAAAFHAWTAVEHAGYTDAAGRPGRIAVEPLTHFTTARAVRESGDGGGALGGIVTLVGRPGMAPGLDSLLPQSALAAGADARRRFAGDRYELTGFALASRVTGSRPAVGRLRAELRHGYGRPDTVGQAPRDPDSLATSLAGFAVQARLARIAGDLQWGLAARAVTRGFEANDAGFQRNADWLLAALEWRYRVYRPGHAIRRWSVGSTQLGYATTTTGLRRAATLNLTLGADLASYWGGSLALDHEFPGYDPEVLRGGPALLMPARDRLGLVAYSDSRRRWQGVLSGHLSRDGATGSLAWDVTPELAGFVSDRVQLGLSPAVAHTRQGWQYVAGAADATGRPRFFVGDLRQWTASLTTRLTVALSPRLTLQGYAQVFLSGGTFGTLAEVVAPRAARPVERVVSLAPQRLTYDSAGRKYVVDPGTPAAAAFADPDFSARTLQTNLLLRWEFLPGSTLFVVWTEARNSDLPLPFNLGADLRRLARAGATDAVEVKISYWLAP
jgi:hypothetical protein